MSLGSALVDRARVVRRESVGVKREGTTVMSDTHGSWFKVRLFLEAAGERDEQGGRKKAVSTPQVLYGLRDLDGELVDLHAEDKLEIASVLGGGHELWRVMEEPQPIAKKRSVIGGLARLERVIEPTRKGVT